MACSNLPIGTRFGMLVVDSEPELKQRKNRRSSFYMFKCDCGVRTGKFLHNIQRGDPDKKSCGCRQTAKLECKECGTKDLAKFAPSNKSLCRKCRTQANLERLRSNPESRKKRIISVRAHQQKSPRNFLIRQIGRTRKHSIKYTDRRSDFNIDIDYILELWDKQKGFCALSGLAMSHRYNDLKSASIDRIDSNKGHVHGNVQIVCKVMNIGKGRHQNFEMKNFLKELLADGSC